MAGLLDGAYSPDPLAMGLLGLGSALMTPRALGGGVGAGMQAFNQGAMQAQLMRRQQQQDALREQLFMAQMDNYRSEAEQRKAAADERRQATERARAQTEGQRRVLESFAGPQPGFRDASIAITGNAPAGYVPPEQRGGQITREMAAAWVANGGDLATLQKLAESPNFGLPEVARVLERRGADNTPEQVREDKYGRPIGAAVPKPFTMQMQDIGGSVVPVNPYAPTALTKTLTPGDVQQARDAAAGRSVTMRGQDMTDRRAREANDVGSWATNWDVGLQVNSRTGETRPITQGGAPIGQKPKDLTDAQSKALLFGTRAADADRVLGERADAGVIRPGSIKSTAETVAGLVPFVGEKLAPVAGSMTNWTQSNAQQSVERAQRDFINAILRRESGAVISPQEFANAQLQYFPSVNDGPDVLAEKARARKLAIEGILAEVPDARRKSLPGSAPTPAQGSSSAASPAARTAAPQTFNSLPPAQQYRGKTVTDTLTGETFKSNGMSWVKQ